MAMVIISMVHIYVRYVFAVIAVTAVMHAHVCELIVELPTTIAGRNPAAILHGETFVKFFAFTKDKDCASKYLAASLKT